MVNPFYSSSQRRLRAVWRLLIQLLLAYLAALFVFVPMAFGPLRAGGQNLSDLASNPDASAGQTLQTILTQPLLAFTGGSFVAILLVVWLAGRFLDRRPFKAFGFHFDPVWWRDLGFGLGLGAALMLLIFAFELAAGWVTVSTPGPSDSLDALFWLGLLSSLILYVVVGIYEELFTRGHLLRNLAEGLNLPWIGPRWALLLAYLLSSFVFSLLHLGNANASALSTANLVLAGLFLGLGFILTGELAISIGLHIAWNFFQRSVFGFPVSGTSSPVSLIALQQAGPELWTGGAFGPEAALIENFALLAGSALVVW